MTQHQINTGEIIIYQPDSALTQIEVRVDEETVWLTQSQMVELFASTKQNVSLHINNIFKEGELEANSTVKEYLTVQREGKRQVKRKVVSYNLDVIISVGYRVKSKRGTQFRIWANRILKEFLLKGYLIDNRIGRVEHDVNDLKRRVDEIDIKLRTELPPSEGIFYDGQIFDAYKFVCDIIKSAHQSIILIDNYIDESIFDLLSKRKSKVKSTIYTSNITRQLRLDLLKHNQQYSEIQLIQFIKSHDRFLIIDEKTVYHIGASLKDLGKKLFAFSKIRIDAADILKYLSDNAAV
ncbi:MAG TPA: RhuM family protein [Bacteroidales bacterium]|jgi:hypothetical protein|nr:RhuM family protein [Bacteroidales bacterium]